MSSYVNLTINTSMYQQIMDALMSYSTNLDNYYDIEEIIHLIDALEEEYQYDMNKQNKDYMLWQEYEKLFHERFKVGKFRNDEGNINEKGMYEYKNFNKVNKVLEDYKEGGTLDILDEKQQFCLVLDLINVMRDE